MTKRLHYLFVVTLLTGVAGMAAFDAAGQGLSSLTPESQTTQTSPPDPRRLDANWWEYFRKDGALDPQRVATALESLSALVEQPASPAATNLAKLRTSIASLGEIEARKIAAPEPYPPLADSYTLSELIELEARRLELAETVALEQGDAQRMETTTRGLRKQLDARFTAYLALPIDSAQRLEEGLGIMADRVVLAISRTRADRAAAALALRRAALKAITQSIETASTRLNPTPNNLAILAPRIAAAATELETATAKLRAAEDKIAGDIASDPTGRATIRLRTQEVVVAAVNNARAQSDLYRLNAQKEWVNLRTVNQDTVPEGVREAAATRAAFISQSREQLEQWRAATERELLNMSDLSSEDGKVANLARKRLGVAQETLLALERLNRSTAELRLVNDLVADELSERLGLLERGVSSGFEEARRWFAVAGGLLGASLFHIGETPVTTAGLLRLLLILVIALWISRLLRSGLNRFARTRAEQNQAAFYTIGRLAHYVIIVIGLMVGLSSIGLNFGNLALVAGALSVGIGFGLQSIVNNFVSGLIILFERSIKVGDFIELDSGLFGTVREINVRSTLINTNDNIDIVVPNSEFVSARLTNWTLRDVDRRVHISFGVAYGTDKDLVRKVVLEAAMKLPYTLKSPKQKLPQVWLVNFGDSSLDFELVVWLSSDAVRRPATTSAEYLWAIETALGEAGIEIPFPQRDLHLRSGFSLDHQGSDQAKED